MARFRAWHLLAGTHLAAGIAGYSMAERERLDVEVEHTGMFASDTKKTLAAAVLSLRKEHKLLVYTWRGAAHVSVERSELLGLLKGTQELTVPATVGYYVELSQLVADDVQWDERAEVVTVHIPRVVLGEVSLHAEAASIRNGSTLTYFDDHVQELTRINFSRAREAFIAASQEETLVSNAEAQAVENIERYFKMALEIAGRPDVEVTARFRDV